MMIPETAMEEDLNPKTWLMYATKLPDDAPLLRLMILNPVNDVMSPLLHHVLIDADPQDFAPGADDLHT